MNRTFQTIAALAVAVCMLTVACKKNDPVVSTSTATTDKTKLNYLFSSFRTLPQYYTVKAGKRQVVYGEEGTKLTFYPNSFKDAAGNIITSGDITIKLIEMYTPGAMISNRATTTSNNNLLQSGGQVYIQATKGGTEVFANKYGIGFNQSAASTQPMQLYYGNTKNADSVVTWSAGTGSFSGTYSEMTSSDSVIASDSSIVYPPPPAWMALYYQFDSCTDFNFINCDYSWASTAPRTDVKITIADKSFDATNTTAYVVFPAINCTSLAWPTLGVYTAYNFPIGTTPVKIVVMGAKGGSYYYYEQTGLSITDGMSINVTTLTLETFDNIKKKLKAL